MNNCVIEIETFKRMPMQYFTPEETRPSEQTLNIIRQIAYSCRSIKLNGKYELYSLN